MIAFFYNNNIHASIETISHEFLKRYRANLNDAFKNKTLKKHF